MLTTKERVDKMISRLREMTPQQRFEALQRAAARLKAVGLEPGTHHLVVPDRGLDCASVRGAYAPVPVEERMCFVTTVEVGDCAEAPAYSAIAA